MSIEINNEVYETRPMDCWPKMKELRRKHFWHTWNAQKQGELLFLGQVYRNQGFLQGWGNYANPSIGVHFTRLTRTPNAEGLTHVIEDAEEYGLGRDVCGAMKAHIGQIFNGMSQTSPQGDKFRHDVAINGLGCHAIMKTTQLAAEYMGVPHFLIDDTFGRHNARTNTIEYDENARKYWLAQMLDFIEWMEEKTGRKFDDEAAIEGLKAEWHSKLTWAKCLELMQNIPSPVSMRTAISLRIPLTTNSSDPEVADYFDILYDELKHRVDNHISDHKYEKIRLTHENQHPLYRADILRSPEKYGAVFVAGVMAEAATIAARDENYHYFIPENPFDKGLELKSRENILDNLWQMRTVSTRSGGPGTLPEVTYHRVMEWNASAVVVHNDRPCQAMMCTSLDRDSYLREKGIPVGNYNSSQGDPRDFDERRILGPNGELPTFYESLGLTRLESK
ncbi:2-hydroxyacyl-CoA dehydratase [Thermodesulfobacteriota bacterium]